MRDKEVIETFAGILDGAYGVFDQFVKLGYETHTDSTVSTTSTSSTTTTSIIPN
jgi:hypothetical protein